MRRLHWSYVAESSPRLITQLHTAVCYALYASARNSNGLRSVMFTRFFRSEIEVVDSGKPNRVSVAVRIHNFFHKPASAIYVPVKVQFRSRS